MSTFEILALRGSRRDYRKTVVTVDAPSAARALELAENALGSATFTVVRERPAASVDVA